ncbi:MAG: murein L,D-transpeptidase YafK [Gammaproteobacteria bacterium]
MGVYFFTQFIKSKELPDLYGDGAFPINYPNIWDRRSGRTGDGMWLHGTPSEIFSRPPEDSNGCVIISNDDLKTLSPFIVLNQTTPVILAQEIEWITKDQWQLRQKSFTSYLEQWRKDWESRDADLYLSHYSKDYEGLGKNYDSWAEHKRRVNPTKAFIKVNLADTSIFSYPGGTEPILVVTFKQNYSSDSFQRVYRKRQYWWMEKDGRWRIIFEGSV